MTQASYLKHIKKTYRPDVMHKGLYYHEQQPCSNLELKLVKTIQQFTEGQSKKKKKHCLELGRTQVALGLSRTSLDLTLTTVMVTVQAAVLYSFSFFFFQGCNPRQIAMLKVQTHVKDRLIHQRYLLIEKKKPCGKHHVLRKGKLQTYIYIYIII